METDYLISNSSRTPSSRRPYHYTPSLQNDNNSDQGGGSNSASLEQWSERANYSRYLYYNRLRRAGAADPDDGMLLIPPHVVPSGFYYPPYLKSADGKNSSVVTIFTIWNTMMGTSLLGMPWAFERSGILTGLLLLIAMAAISFYTAYRILEVYENNESSAIQDFAILCKRLLGRWAQVMALIFSVLTLLGAAIVYWVLLSNFLFHTVDFIHKIIISDVSPFATNASDVYCPMDNTTLETDELPDDTFHRFWTLHKTVPLLLVVLLGPIICIRSPTFFAKFNSLGTLSVIYIFVFIFVKSSKFGINISLWDSSSPSYTPLFKPTFPALSGMLSLAFFIHNCIVTIMRNNRDRRKNKRDLGISFVIVALTYFLIGGVFFVIFPLDKSCIEDNFLNNFRSSDAWTFAARIFLFFQILTVFPLIVYILRVQVCYSLTKKEPSIFLTILSNLIIMAICVCFAIWLPQIGTITRFTGAICGLVYSFFLPVCLYLRWQQNLNTLSNSDIFAHVVLFLLGLCNFILQFVVSP